MQLCLRLIRPSDRPVAGGRFIIGLLAMVLGPLGVPAQQPQNDIRAGTQQADSSAQHLHLMVGRSLVINSPTRLKRVSVADPAIADAVVVNPTQILVNGKAPGGVSLVLWDEFDQSTSFDLTVSLDVLGISQRIRSSFPSEAITVEASRDSLIVGGKASSKVVADKVVEVATSVTPKVINLIEIPAAPSVGEILIEVKFAEVNRVALEQFGFNLFSLAGPTTRTFGVTTTQQFAPPQIPAGGTDGTSIELNDLLNITIFRPDVDLGATIRALRQQNILQILAEPNLVTQNGKEAKFLAGGEFPFPVLQTGQGGFNGITIVFKEFGVRLSFTPTVTPEGRIHLKVNPEVSSLDFTNALTVSGFLIPALSTRRVETQMELQDGQSFAVAGLVDDRVAESMQKIPLLGDIPILGKLFRSRSSNKSKNELLVVVTPRIVKPSEPVPPGPQFPKPFLPAAPAGKPAT